MKGNELVWRALADAALLGRREWPSLADLAHAAGTPVSTAALALHRLYAIGAAEKQRGGGVILVNPEKTVTVLAAWRNLANDTLARTSITGIEPWLDRTKGSYALGGSDAALTFLTDPLGPNMVATHGTRLVYLPESADLSGLPAGGDVIVLGMDERAQFDWHDGYTSRAQTYADLFALPGWQAEEFRQALHRALFPTADWSHESRRRA